MSVLDEVVMETEVEDAVVELGKDFEVVMENVVLEVGLAVTVDIVLVGEMTSKSLPSPTIASSTSVLIATSSNSDTLHVEVVMEKVLLEVGLAVTVDIALVGEMTLAVTVDLVLVTLVGMSLVVDNNYSASGWDKFGCGYSASGWVGCGYSASQV